MFILWLEKVLGGLSHLGKPACSYTTTTLCYGMGMFPKACPLSWHASKHQIQEKRWTLASGWRRAGDVEMWSRDMLESAVPWRSLTNDVAVCIIKHLMPAAVSKRNNLGTSEMLDTSSTIMSAPLSLVSLLSLLSLLSHPLPGHLRIELVKGVFEILISPWMLYICVHLCVGMSPLPK